MGFERVVPFTVCRQKSDAESCCMQRPYRLELWLELLTVGQDSQSELE